MKYLISACLIGQAVRYDAGHCKVNVLQQLVEQNKAVVICPEMTGGLTTPRAYQALALAQKHQITYAVLKANSPSCGSDLIYDGSFSGKKIAGAGVTAALLTRYGFQVISEDTFSKQLT